jgi:hypothetical protein
MGRHATVVKFNTSNTQTIPLLPLRSDYVYVLEDLELAFPKDQITSITKRWNQGEDMESIAKDLKRHPDEVFLALFHQARRDRVTRPFGFRRG